MASGSSKSTLAAARYVAALLDLAAQSKLVDKVEKDMTDLAAMIAGSVELRALIGNPLFSRGKQQTGIMALAAKAGFQQVTASFLGVVAANRRLPLLPQIIKTFQQELRRRRGEVQAEVQTAFALSPAQTDALQKQLSQATGAAVTLSVKVDPALLGGMVVTVGSRMVDDSVRRKLERLQRVMSSGSNENQSHLKEVG